MPTSGISPDYPYHLLMACISVEAARRYTFGNPVHSICFERRSIHFELKQVEKIVVYHYAVATSEAALSLV